MDFTTIRELYRNSEAYVGKEVTVGGWVRSIRDSKTFGFIVLHDGTFFETLQIVYADKLENFAEICKYNVGAASSAYQYFPGSIPCSFSDCLCNPQILPGERFCVCTRSTDYFQ